MSIAIMARPTKRKLRVAVVTYYRVRAMNPNTTLKEICDRMGLNYQTVRNYKVQYDKARKKQVQQQPDLSDQDQRNG